MAKAKPQEHGRIWTWIEADDVKDIKPKSALAKRATALLAEQRTELWNKYLGAGKSRSRDGDLEIEDDATVSVSEDSGAYVLAWLWISNEEAGIPDPEEQEAA